MSRMRITLSFQPDNPQHMKAYTALMRLPVGARSGYVAEMINRGEDMEQYVYAAVTRALCAHSPTISNEPEKSDTRQIPKDMLDFAFSL